MTLPLGGPLHPGWASGQAGLSTEPCLTGPAHHAGLVTKTQSGHQACPWASPGGCSPTPWEGLWVGTACLLLKGAIL